MKAINLIDINLDKLPSVKLEDRKELPEDSGIYFVIDSKGIVQYIGRSNNLKNRWNAHHRQNQLETFNSIQIVYLLVNDRSLLDEIEQVLIKWFEPRLNFTQVDTGNTTKKERIVFYVDQSVKDKLGEFAQDENRSLSNWLENLVLNEIQKRVFIDNQEPTANSQQPTAK